MNPAPVSEESSMSPLTTWRRDACSNHLRRKRVN